MVLRGNPDSLTGVLLWSAGELVTAAASVFALFLAWLMWGTSPQPTAMQQQINRTIRNSWQRHTPAPGKQGGGATDAIALIRIPALGSRWQYPVYPGTADSALARGLGHYSATAMPGQAGNFAIAGHRSSATGFEPLADLPTDIAPGDQIIIDTASEKYVYAVDRTKQTSQHDIAVLEPDQGRGANPQQDLITITTCTPRYGHSGRFIVFGHLVLSQPQAS